MVRPKTVKNPIIKNLYLDADQWSYIQDAGFKPSQFIRKLIDVSINKKDIYKINQDQTAEINKLNSEIKLLNKKVTVANLKVVKYAMKKEKEMEEQKITLSEAEELISQDPSNFLEWITMTEDNKISQEVFTNKFKMSLLRANLIKEQYL